MGIGKIIRKFRTDRKLTQTELADMIGTTKQNIYKYETGIITNIPSDKIEAMANIFNVTPAFLMGWEHSAVKSDNINRFDNIEEIKTKKIPMLGSIACGQPVFAEEQHEVCVPVSDDIKADFCLRTKGDSMINAKIYDNDVVFIKKQDMVENGEIAVVIIDDEATLKRVYYDKPNNIIQLIAENPAYSPIIYSGEKLNEIRILGKAIAVLSML